jgi:ADP-ribosylglycohydrolase
MSDSDLDSARAVIYGLALGDALGWPVEFFARSHIRAKYGRAGITVPPDPALYTDDTQMSTAMAEALVESGEKDIDTFMTSLANKFVAWKNDPITATRAPGTTCIRGVNALELGAPWNEAGVKDSKGCGACMRVAPIGYFYQHDVSSLSNIARSQAWLTHRHPTSDAASVGAAYLVKLALDGAEPQVFPDRLLSFVGGQSDEFEEAIKRVIEVRDWPDAEAALDHIGRTRGGGWIAEEAVAMALYCVLKHPDNYTAAVILGANIDGDSDTVACITGGILGARLGLAALPQNWLTRLENRDYLGHLADRLAEKKSSMTNEIK